MKLNKKSKSKGKVHPSPSSSSSSASSSSSSSSASSSSSSSSSNDVVSNLNKLLPTTILTLISVLSLQDKEVLAYMITHSLSSSSSTTTTTTSFFTKGGKKVTHQSGKSKLINTNTNTPTFDCGCFDCYTTYWFRWDSSPHRELIHEAIEAFEEHLATSELPTKITSKSSRKRDKVSEVKSCVLTAVVEVEVEEVKSELSPEIREVPADDGGDDVEVKEESGAHEKKKMVRQQQQQQHKGLARKVLPDVIGLFNSRLWSLWGPNV